MKIRLLFLCLVLISINTSASDEKHLNAALDVVEMPKGVNLDQLANVIVSAQLRINPSLAPRKQTMTKSTKEMLQSDDFKRLLATAYMEVFSYDELIELKKMMQQPIFIKLQEKTPVLMSKLMNLGDQYVRENTDKFLAQARQEKTTTESKPLPPGQPINPTAGTEFRDCETCPAMIVVPAGSFMMGSPGDEAGHEEHESPLHLVTIAHPFAVGKYEVTRGEWRVCVMDGVCGKRAGLLRSLYLDHPISHISWKETQTYIKWLSKKTGQTYRLLSEAEWEYVARAGTASKYSFLGSAGGLCKSANIGDQSALKKGLLYEAESCDDGYQESSPVGTFKPNAFGLYDVHGNVEEWVEDCYHKSYQGAPKDGSAWATDKCKYTQRVLRGGSFFSSPARLRSASRFWATSDLHFTHASIGFRVARVLD